MKRVQAPPNFKVDLQIEPRDFMAASNAALKVKMAAINQGKEKFILEFPSAQHFEFVIQNSAGKEMYRWSRDKEFAQKFSSIVVNWNEKISYEEEVFSVSNQAVRLPPGEYRTRGEITAQTPISVESSFRVLAVE